MSYTKNISALAVSQIITAVCNFISALLIAKMLLPAGQGQWSLYVNAYAFGAVALSFGLPQALTYHIASKKLAKEQVLSHALLFALIVGLVFALVVFILIQSSSSNIFLPNDIPAYWVCIGLGLHFTLLMAQQLFAAVFHANKAFITAASIALSGAVLLVIIYSSFYFISVQGYREYFEGFIVGNITVLVIQCVIAFWILRNKLNYTFSFSHFTFNFYKPLMAFAAWIYITNMLQFLNYKMDVWFISGFVSDQKVLGIYTVAASLAQLLWLIPIAFHSIIFTDIAVNNSQELRLKIKSWVNKILVGSALLAVIGYLLSFILVPILFGNEYSPITTVLPYLLPGVVVFSSSILLSAYFSGINRIEVNFKSTALGFLVCVVLNFCLIPSFGIIGAAISSSVSYSVSAIYLYYLFSKE